MIKREMYMSRIRPFIGSELIKVMTGIRRCGKSVMLELIKEELTASGAAPSQFISINFEDMSYAHLQNAQALHAEIRQGRQASRARCTYSLTRFRNAHKHGLPSSSSLKMDVLTILSPALFWVCEVVKPPHTR